LLISNKYFMKNIFTILVTLFILTTTLYTEECQAQWLHTNGPCGGHFVCFVATSSKIFTGSYGSGVFSSTNNGTSWTTANNGLLNKQIKSFAISGSNIFVGN